MMSLRNRPLPTEVLDDPRQFMPDSGSVYVYCVSSEDRSSHIDMWKDAAKAVTLVEILEHTRSDFRYRMQQEIGTVALRSRADLCHFWNVCSGSVAYVDITGLPHHVWAPLVQAAMQAGVAIRVVYAEPREYRFHASPTPAGARACHGALRSSPGRPPRSRI